MVPLPGDDNPSGREGAWTDRAVLEGVRRRDADSLARFFDVAFPYVFSLACRLTGNRHTAEDVAQDVFLKVHRAADRLDVDRHPKPWITAITYNACRDVARRASASPEESTDATLVGERHESPGTPADELEQRERERLVERALRTLDDLSRAVVILYDYCGYSHEEIAGVVGASHAAVRKRYSRALSKMGETIRGSME
jgi:RNA polymerase sigma factor (sigma-70 family)